jgi:hypothetical protein
MPAAVIHEVSHESPGFVVEIMPRDKDLKALPYGEPVEHLPFEQSAEGTDPPSRSTLDFHQVVPEDLFEGILGPGKASIPGEPIHGSRGRIRKVVDAQADVQPPGDMSELVEDVPEGEGVFAARNRYQERGGSGNVVFLHGPANRCSKKVSETVGAKVHVMVGKADRRLAAAACALGVGREWRRNLLHVLKDLSSETVLACDGRGS